MKIYVGIRQCNPYIYIAALNNQGKTILKTIFPSSCHPRTIVNSLDALQEAFGATLRIATCMEENLQHILAAYLQEKFHFVRLLESSVYYLTDFFPEEKLYAPADPYRHAMLLALLDSLEQ